MKSKKITVLSIYPIFPPNSGFKNRVYYLFREIAAQGVKVEIVSLTGINQPSLNLEIAPNLYEIRIPKSQNQVNKELELAEELELAREDIFDLTQIMLFEETPDFINAFVESSKDADWVICSQPYFYPMVQKYYTGKLVYDAHNVEFLLKKQLIGDNPNSNRLLDLLYHTEKELCVCADLVSVVTSTDEDIMSFSKLYNIQLPHGLSVPIGVDLEESRFISPDERLKNKEAVGIQGQTALFIGSAHKPNIDACSLIIDMAKQAAGTTFMLMGTCCNSFSTQNLPENVKLLGVLSNDEKNRVLGFVDVALNPIIRGEGVNVKMLDYLAGGVPVITTPLGKRGLGLPDNAITVCEVDEFLTCLENIDFNRVYSAREHVEKNFSWSVIAENFYSRLFN